MPTWYLTNDSVSVGSDLSMTDPGAEAFRSPVTGWVVSTGATLHSEWFNDVERAATTFTGTTVPDGSLDTTNGDFWTSPTALTGNFASANWNIHFACRANTLGDTQDGRIRIRLFRGANQNGSSATEITSAQQQGSLVTNLLTSATQVSTVTFNPGAFSVTNEYIFIQLAWERTGASGMTTGDVNARIGNGSGTGSRVITSNFFATGGASAGGAATTIGAASARVGASASAAGAATATMAGSSETLVGFPTDYVAWYQYNRGITEVSGAVSQWDDQSGNANHITQGTAGNRPIRQADGSILFDGTDDYLISSAFTLNQPHTRYILLKQVSWASGDEWSDGAVNNTGTLYQKTTTPRIGTYAGSFGPENDDLAVGTYAVLIAVFNGASSVLQINSGTATTGDVGAANMGGFIIGALLSWSK